MKQAGLFELNAVVAVATRRSFRAAAAELGMSPSALSHAIGTLEQRLGVRLFHRTTRSVALSEAGAQFIARIRPALRDIAEAIEDINDFRDTPAGTLRLNTSEGAARQILTPLVLRYLALYPDMTVDIVTDGRFVDIVAEGFDAGIRTLDSVPGDMIAVPVGGPQRFCVVATPGYFAGRDLPAVPGDLLGHRCIRRRMPSGVPYRWEFEKGGETLEVDVPGPLILDHDALMLEAALAGAGIAYLIEHAALAHVVAGRLHRVLEDWTPPFPGMALYYPGRRHVPAGLRAFIDLIRQT